jgi:multimeric flavodoxin WrbA
MSKVRLTAISKPWRRPSPTGAREAGAQVNIQRAPELVPDEVARNVHQEVDQAAPIAKVDDLAAYDAIIIGTGTRFGQVSSQMANFLDQAGGLWARGHYEIRACRCRRDRCPG